MRNCQGFWQKLIGCDRALCEKPGFYFIFGYVAKVWVIFPVSGCWVLGAIAGLRNRVSAEDIGKNPLYFGKKPGFSALGFGKDVRSHRFKMKKTGFLRNISVKNQRCCEETRFSSCEKRKMEESNPYSYPYSCFQDRLPTIQQHLP